MKKYIQYFAIVFMLMIVTACGSNSKEDPTSSSSSTSSSTATSSGGLSTGDTTSSTTSTDTSVVDSAEYTFINASTPLEVTNASTTYTIKVQLIQHQLPVSGETVQLKAFQNPKDQYGTFTSMSVSTDELGYATFEYTSPSNLTAVNNSIIKLEAVLYYGESSDGNTTSYQELTQEFILSFKNSGTDNPDDNTTNYYFTNASTPMQIVETETQYTIKVQLVDNGFPVSGESVKLKVFSNPSDIYGSFNAMSATTDSLGYASFSYVSPADISPINNQKLTLTAVLEDDKDITQTFELDFNKTEAVVVSEKPFVVIPNSSKTIELNNNSQQAIIPINVYEGETNSPYSKGTVKVILPAKIVDGVDVGKFESYSVEIENGVASFAYTGPQDLQALIDSGDSSSTFQFYHEDDPTNKKSMTVSYNPASEYIPTNYTLEVSSEDGNFTMGIPNQLKTFSVVLKDDKGENVAKEYVTSTEIELQNSFVGKLIEDKLEVTGTTVTQQNPVTFNVTSNTTSGLIPVEIKVNFKDANDVEKSISKTVNITVYSGPPTAISISYVGVEQDKERGKYIENFAITATDAYNNKVNTSPNIAVGAVVGYAVDGSAPSSTETSTTGRIYFGSDATQKGTITPIGGDKATFSIPNDGSNRFQYVDPDNDKLVLFGEGYKYEALGKWDFTLGDTPYELNLKDDYFGIQRDDLLYAIGNNYRQDPCRDDGTEYVGFAEASSYQLDEEGTAKATFKYDYHLTGKDIMFWVNLTGYQADTGKTVRMGEAKKHTLRGNGLYSVPEGGYTLKAYESSYATFSIWHENAPEYYRNANFGWAVESGSTCSYHEVYSSQDVYKLNYVIGEQDENNASLIHYTPMTSYVPNYDANTTLVSVEHNRTRDPRECVREGGRSFVTFFLEAGDEDCSFNITRIMTSSEF
jgi:hypothetical protein